MKEHMIPESMVFFVEAIGASATMSVIRAFGGGRIYIPKRVALDDAHPLVRLLGMPLADKLAEHLGGERYEIPRATAVEAQIRNDAIRRRFLEGTSVRQIALSFGISKSSVWQVIRSAQFVPPDNHRH